MSEEVERLKKLLAAEEAKSSRLQKALTRTYQELSEVKTKLRHEENSLVKAQREIRIMKAKTTAERNRLKVAREIQKEIEEDE